MIRYAFRAWRLVVGRVVAGLLFVAWLRGRV